MSLLSTLDYKEQSPPIVIQGTIHPCFPSVHTNITNDADREHVGAGLGMHFIHGVNTASLQLGAVLLRLQRY